VLVYDLGRNDRTPREYAYRTDPLSRPGSFGEARGGLGVSDLLALSATELLVLERGYVVEEAAASPRSVNTIRLYRVTLDAAADVTGRASLEEQPPAAVLRKTLVFDAATVAPQLSERLRTLENFEAITFGPRLPDGRRSLLLLSDDNFNVHQATAMLVLGLPGP
jgi:3-phytase